MKIALGSDHAGFELKETIKGLLLGKGLNVVDVGTARNERCNYAEFGLLAARKVQDGSCDLGIVICGTGVGISLAANKLPGIRCCVCSEPYSAAMSRQHNDGNMLALGARVVGVDLAQMIVEAWLASEFEGGRHALRVAQLKEIEETGTIAALNEGC